jgi:transposase
VILGGKVLTTESNYTLKVYFANAIFCLNLYWNGITAYCKPENKVALGFVEGLNTKIRVIQRRAYGLRDEEYLRLKILTCMLLPI